MKEYFKWLFTRWYLYVLTLIAFVGDMGVGVYGMVGSFLGNFVGVMLIISFFVGIKKLYLKFRKS